MVPHLSGLLKRCSRCHGRRGLPFVGLDGLNDRETSLAVQVLAYVRHMRVWKRAWSQVNAVTLIERGKREFCATGPGL